MGWYSRQPNSETRKAISCLCIDQTTPRHVATYHKSSVHLESSFELLKLNLNLNLTLDLNLNLKNPLNSNLKLTLTIQFYSFLFYSIRFDSILFFSFLFYSTASHSLFLCQAHVNLKSGPMDAKGVAHNEAGCTYEESENSRFTHFTPLHMAAQVGSPEIVKLLLDCGAKQTPLNLENVVQHVYPDDEWNLPRKNVVINSPWVKENKPGK